MGRGRPLRSRAQAEAAANSALRSHGMTHAAGAIHFYKAFLDGDGKEMAWSELIGWMSALTRPTHGF
jgi:hypothetical protein